MFKIWIPFYFYPAKTDASMQLLSSVPDYPSSIHSAALKMRNEKSIARKHLSDPRFILIWTILIKWLVWGMGQWGEGRFRPSNIHAIPYVPLIKHICQILTINLLEIYKIYNLFWMEPGLGRVSKVIPVPDPGYRCPYPYPYPIGYGYKSLYPYPNTRKIPENFKISKNII